MNGKSASWLVGVCVAASAIGSEGRAQAPDPGPDIAVCTSPHRTGSTFVTGDGLGGVLVAWVDLRDDALGDVYLQRIGPDGSVRWRANGVAVCSAPGAQTQPTAVGDGSGGAYVAWQDGRATGSRVYVQHVDRTGQPVLAADGSPVCTAAGFEDFPAIATDGAGGAFVAWLDDRDGHMGHFGQRIARDGTLLWPVDGAVIDTSLGNLGSPPRLLASEQGRVIALTRKVGGLSVRKLGERGRSLWSSDGVSPCSSCVPIQFDAVPDGAGGAALVWTETSQSGESRVIAQRVSTDGNLPWGIDGQLVYGSTYSQDSPAIAVSGDGGAFIAWRNTGFANPRIFAQRLDPDGAKRWGESGIRAVSIGRGQGNLALAQDGSGGLFMLWQMFFESSTYDMFAQRLDGSGNALWQAEGSRLPTDSQPRTVGHMEHNGDGGATVVWEGVRNGVAEIDAKWIDRSGFAAPTPATSVANAVFLWSPAPNPTPGPVTLRLAVRSTMPLTLAVIDIAGRHIKSLLNGKVTPGLYSIDWDGKRDDESISPPGVYFVRCDSEVGHLVTRVDLVR